MTEGETLKQRRELVLLAAELQRATLSRRLERIEANPARRILGIAASAVRNPAVVKVGTALVIYAFRAYRNKRRTRFLQPRISTRN